MSPTWALTLTLVCIQCEDVVDADAGQEAIVRLKNQISKQSDFKVAWQRVDFYGWCPRCAEARHQNQPVTTV